MVLISGLALVFHLFNLTGLAEWRIGLPLLYALRGAVPAPEGAVVVSVGTGALRDLQGRLSDDDTVARSLQNCGPPSFIEDVARARGSAEIPRRLYACLVSRLAGMGATTIVMDIHFALPGHATEDTALARAIAEAGNVYLLDSLRVLPGGAPLRAPPHALFRAAAAGTGPFVIAHEGGRPWGYRAKIAGLDDLCPLPLVAGAAACADVPVGAAGDVVPLWIYGPGGTVRTVAMSDILAAEVTAKLTDTVVFVGAGRDGQLGKDTFPDAWTGAGSGAINGVELLATAYLNMRDGGPPRPLTVLLLAGVLALQGAAFGAAAGAGRHGWIAIALVALALAATGAIAFAEMRLMLPVATPLLVLAPAAGLLWAMGRNARMRALVSRLVPRVAAGIVLGEARMAVGLRPCVAVALDMAGSTAFQNTHGAERFAARQSALYALFSECLAAQGGHVIKYTGDGAMAVFFAEAERRPEHLAAAAVAALRTFAERWRTLADHQQARGEPAIAVRIGLEAGEARLSITETPDRLIVDAAGEPLNVAARLEAFAKTVAGEALVTVVAGERVVAALGEGAPDWEPLGSQSLRGVEASVNVHRLVV